MSQVVGPVDFKPQVIVSMDHFVCHCILQMSLILHFICAYKDSVFRIESASFSIRAATAIDIVIGEVAPELSNIVA